LIEKPPIYHYGLKLICHPPSNKLSAIRNIRDQPLEVNESHLGQLGRGMVAVKSKSFIAWVT
jgi:hypothetical protein